MTQAQAMAIASAQDFNRFIGMVRSGDVESAKTFLSSHQIDLNNVIPKGESFVFGSSRIELTPLMLACRLEHLKMVKLLIEEGAEVNFLTSSYPTRSALVLAVTEKKLDVVKLLMCDGAQAMDTKAMDITESSGRECALFTACEQGDVEIVKALLPKGPKSANVAKWPSSNLTVSGSTTRPHYESFECLMSPVSIAAKKGHLQLLTWLLKGGAEVPANCLHIAMYGRNNSTPNIDIVKLLLKLGAKVNETGKGVSALMMASCYGDIEIIEILLKQGADVDHKSEDNNFSLWIAAVEGYTEAVKILLKGGADVNLKGDVAILQGLLECYEMPEDKIAPIFRTLLAAGADIIPEKPYRQDTVLTAAIKRGLIEVVKVLLDLKKEDLVIDMENSLLTAVKRCPKNSAGIVEILIEAGARTDQLDINGESLLMITRNAAIAKMLLNKGVPIDQQSNDGSYALLHAIERADFEVVELLLEKGADLDLQADDGTTAKNVLQEKQVIN